MASTTSTRDFERTIALITADLAPERVAKDLAALARTSLSEVIRSGEGSPRYNKFVNGRFNADEESVIPPGPIVYDFHWWNEIIEYAIEVLRKRSPVDTGRYRDSWFAMVNGVVVTDYSSIPVGAKVFVTNNQPYARKIEVGHMRMSVPDGVAEDGTMIVRRRFGNVAEIKTTMITLPGGYILKGRFTKGYKPNARTKLRRDVEAGTEMTYPALAMTLRV